MKKLILLELRLILPTFVFIYAAMLILTPILKTSVLFIFFPALAVAVANSVARRSVWYLNLPWSRAKVMLAIFIQNLVVWLVNLAMSCAILFVLAHTLSDEMTISLTDYKAAFWFSVLGFTLGATVSVLTGRPIQRRPSGSLLTMKAARKCAAFAFVIGMGWWLKLYQEPILYWSVLVATPFILFWMLCYQIVLPRTDLKRVVQVSRIAIVTLVVAPAVGAILIVNYGNPESKWMDRAVQGLGRVPSFVSDERAKYLFVRSVVGRSPAMVQHLAAITSGVTATDWERRTMKCTSDECLDLSADVVGVKNLSLPNGGSSFLVLMGPCNFKVADDGIVRCHGPRLGRKRLNWPISQNGAGQFLGSEPPERQRRAI